MKHFDVIECGTEAEWIAERDRGVGASEAAVVFGLSKWSSPAHLWAQKTGQMDPGGSDAEYLEYGRFMEQGCAARYEFRTHRKLKDLGRFTILRSKRWPWLFATLDRIIEEVPEGEFGLYPKQPFMDGPGVCEIKSPVIYGYQQWDEGVPLHYQIQLQTQLAVTGYKWGSFGAQMPTGKFDCIDVERNDAFIEMLAERTGQFWRCVQDHTWPPVGGSKWDSEALKAIYPRDNGSMVELPAESAVWDEQLLQAKADKKDAEARELEAKNNFAKAIGEASFGVLPSGEIYTYKTKTTPAHTRKESTTRELRRAK